jgi:hypothetical protein
MLKKVSTLLLVAMLALGLVAAITVINLATQVTGLLSISHGGTGSSTGEYSTTGSGSGSIVLSGSSSGSATIAVGSTGALSMPGFLDTGTQDLGTQAETLQVVNDTTTGTTNKLVAKLSSGKALKAGTGDSKSYTLLGIVVTGGTNSGNASIATAGTATCTFDAAATQGNWVGLSTGTAGDCKDLGASLPTDGSLTLGVVAASIGGAGDTTVYVFGPQVLLTNTVVAGTNLKITYNALGQVTAGATAACADLSNGAASCSTDTTNAANIGSGTLPAGRMPALTGDITTSAGAVATTLNHMYHQNFGTITAPTCSVGGVTTFIGIANSSTTEASVVHFLPTENYTISKFVVGLAANVPASESAVFTVMDNSVGQTVTCTVGAGTSACTDNAHSFTTTGGSHIIDIKVVCSGGTTALTQPIFIGMGYK